MKNMILFAVVSLVTVSASATSLTCYGTNEAKNQILLSIEDTLQATRQEFKAVNISAVVYPFVGAEIALIPQALKGCQGALLAGSKGQILNADYSGDLYIECAGDGDAGFITLQKQKSDRYVGTFFAPNGKEQLNLSDEEEMPLTCIPQ